MSCIQTYNGIGLSCADATGGIKEVYIADLSTIASVTIESDEITAIAMSGNAKFKAFKMRKQTGSVTSTVNNDDAAGTSYISSEIALQFTKQETAKRLEIQKLIAGNSAVIVKDGNDNYFYFGKDNPVTCTAGTASTGTAFGDFNGYNVTLTDVSKELPYQISETAITSEIIDFGE